VDGVLADGGGGVEELDLAKVGGEGGEALGVLEGGVNLKRERKEKKKKLVKYRVKFFYFIVSKKKKKLSSFY
jgi:hypothetical protein